MLDFMTTFRARKIYPLKPDPSQIDIRDIAHSLSLLCRFNGHTIQFYSIAEHCVRVARQCKNKAWGLLHDASEAYLGDLITPIKYDPTMEFYRDVESQYMSIIMNKFGLSSVEPEDVTYFDKVLLVTEIRDLMNFGDQSMLREYLLKYTPLPGTIVPMSPAFAEKAFLDLAEELNLL